MQFTRNTSIRKPKNSLLLLIKVTIILLAVITVVVLLNKIDFPSPEKKIEKIIPNANLKIVK